MPKCTTDNCPKDYETKILFKHFSSCLIFPFDWDAIDLKDKQNISQVLVSIKADLAIDNIPYGLKGLIARNYQRNYLIIRDSNASWCNLNRTSSNIIGNGSWYDALLSLFLDNSLPTTLIYEQGEASNAILNNNQVFILENFGYFRENLTDKVINGYYKIITNPDCGYFKEEHVVACPYCSSEKIEGIECECCRYNEGPWECANHHKNPHQSFTCDYCLENRCNILGIEPFLCTDCNDYSIGQQYCQFCPTTQCFTCKKDILPYRSSYCVDCLSFAPSINQGHNGLCRDCATEFTS